VLTANGAWVQAGMASKHGFDRSLARFPRTHSKKACNVGQITSLYPSSEELACGLETAAGFFVWNFQIGRRPAFTASVYSHVGALTLGASLSRRRLSLVIQALLSKPCCPSITLDLPARANVPVRGGAEAPGRTRPHEG